MAAKGVERCHLFLPSRVSCSVSLTTHGLSLTSMSQTNLLKLDRVQNEAMRVILGTINRHTYRDHAVHARPPNSSSQTECETAQSMFLCCLRGSKFCLRALKFCLQERVLSSGFQVLSPRKQVLSLGMQILSPRKHILSSGMQVLSPRKQVLSLGMQVMSPRKQVLSSRRQVLSSSISVIPEVISAIGSYRFACDIFDSFEELQSSEAV